MIVLSTIAPYSLVIGDDGELDLTIGSEGLQSDKVADHSMDEVVQLRDQAKASFRHWKRCAMLLEGLRGAICNLESDIMREFDRAIEQLKGDDDDE